MTTQLNHLPELSLHLMAGTDELREIYCTSNERGHIFGFPYKRI